MKEDNNKKKLNEVSAEDYEKMYGEMVLKELKEKVERKITQNDPLIIKAIKSMISENEDLPDYVKNFKK